MEPAHKRPQPSEVTGEQQRPTKKVTPNVHNKKMAERQSVGKKRFLDMLKTPETNTASKKGSDGTAGNERAEDRQHAKMEKQNMILEKEIADIEQGIAAKQKILADIEDKKSKASGDFGQEISEGSELISIDEWNDRCQWLDKIFKSQGN